MRKVIVTATATAAAAALAVANIAAATSTTKAETFTAITTNPGSGVASLIATGGFTAGGTLVVDKKHTERFRFAGGKFTLVLGTPGSKHQSLNLTTCLYTKTGSASYTLADGTGVYKGISGSGKVSFTLRAVYPLVKGKCPSSDQPGSSGTPTAIQFIETGRGPVSLPSPPIGGRHDQLAPRISREVVAPQPARGNSSRAKGQPPQPHQAAPPGDDTRRP